MLPHVRALAKGPVRPLLWCGLILCGLLTACTAVKNRTHATPPVIAGATGTLPRADPGYVQWLERQSMLGNAPQLTALVSGTDKTLRASSVDGARRDNEKAMDRIDTLLVAADVWLYVDAASLITARLRPVWEELAAAEHVRLLDALHVRGLYVGATVEGGEIWGNERRSSSNGDEPTSLFFAPHVGTDKQFEVLAQTAARHQWQLGADLAPAASGLGPDFFLAARQVREYPGVYMMLEVPEALWPQLPASPDAWTVKALDQTQLNMLVEKGLLPPLLARDRLDWAKPGGWAVTGEVRGADGVNRRWLYRYHQKAQRPQLHWDDPSGNARKIFSASVIRQVGLLQHTLTGVRLEPMAGLDPMAEATTNPTWEPAPSALRDLGREVRRYGGWLALLDEEFPVGAAQPALTGADFVHDVRTNVAARAALRSGDAAALRALLTGDVPQHDQRRMLRQVTGLVGPGLLTATPAGEVLKDTKAREQLQQQHILLSLFQGGLPGLLLVSGQDLAGSLQAPPAAGDKAKSGGWSLYLPDTAAQTRQGNARSAALYPSLAEQLTQAGSLGDTVAKLSLARQKHGIARASYVAVARTRQAGSAGFWLKLPDGHSALVLANFSPKTVTESVPLPPALKASRGPLWDMLEDKGFGQGVDGEVTVTLAPYQCLWLRMAS